MPVISLVSVSFLEVLNDTVVFVLINGMANSPFLMEIILSDKFSINEKSPAYNVKTSIAGDFLVKGYIEERAMEIARYIIDNNTTVRQAAKHFGISKSTVHKDVTERLVQINPSLAAETRKVLDVNKSERHIRGGLATKEKYLHQHC